MDLPPRKPDDSECCGSGCSRCVFDVYEEELKIWRRKSEQVSGVGTQELHPDKYTDLRIEKIERTSIDSYIYFLSSKNSNQVLVSLKAGEHIILKGNLREQSIVRQFTPLNLGRNLTELKVAIKLYDDGKMSSIIRMWKIGDLVQCRAPLGNGIEYQCNKWEAVVLVAAGTGITPMAQIIQTILQDENEETAIILLYACRTYEEILIKDMLDLWSDSWNFSVFYYLSREITGKINGKKKYRDEIFCKRIDLDALKQSCSSVNISKSCAFVCGPSSFETDIECLLLSCGFAHENVRRF